MVRAKTNLTSNFILRPLRFLSLYVKSERSTPIQLWVVASRGVALVTQRQSNTVRIVLVADRSTSIAGQSFSTALAASIRFVLVSLVSWRIHVRKPPSSIAINTGVSHTHCRRRTQFCARTVRETHIHIASSPIPFSHCARYFTHPLSAAHTDLRTHCARDTHIYCRRHNQRPSSQNVSCSFCVCAVTAISFSSSSSTLPDTYIGASLVREQIIIIIINGT